MVFSRFRSMTLRTGTKKDSSMRWNDGVDRAGVRPAVIPANAGIHLDFQPSTANDTADQKQNGFQHALE
jgi:hypothetical protein